MQSDTAKDCIERYLLFQSERKWEAMLSLVSDDYLVRKYSLLQDSCTPEAAARYGYKSVEQARADHVRSFVLRMLKNSERDAEGANPCLDAIPANADCHIRCSDDEVVVTLSTPFANYRTKYRTRRLSCGSRKIVESRVSRT